MMDLTSVYCSLATLYQQLQYPLEKQFSCYRDAAEALPTPNTLFPATRIQKAKAHYYAHLIASRLHLENESTLHLSKAKEYAPEIKFEYDGEVQRYFEDGRFALTPDVASHLAQLAEEANRNGT